MRGLTSFLTVLSLVLAGSAASAATPSPLNRRQLGEVRKEVRSLMGYSFRLFKGRNPVLHLQLTPTGARRVEANAQIVIDWRGGRSVEATGFGVIHVPPNGRWRFVKGPG